MDWTGAGRLATHEHAHGQATVPSRAFATGRIVFATTQCMGRSSVLRYAMASARGGEKWYAKDHEKKKKKESRLVPAGPTEHKLFSLRGPAGPPSDAVCEFCQEGTLYIRTTSTSGTRSKCILASLALFCSPPFLSSFICRRLSAKRVPNSEGQSACS